jgi:hypothetical protein
MSQNIRIGSAEKKIIIDFLKTLSTSTPDDLLPTNKELLCAKVQALLLSKFLRKELQRLLQLVTHLSYMWKC